ncbi:FHA domain-containing protein [Telmatocola sphagniphila]|uniref:FHA domain-containing protein n=1 Tax=Telmatocola sphagniphila TaxID=1123043 RepID=A0A8E6EZ21_9BACT|nr:FHA domain-containing protein [Telmatocola sphagniphila]QVL33278.1 FHA domain-containing protein [Telmatocola sphagniphila]
MKFYLIVAKGKKQGMPIPIDVDLFVVGREKMCQLRSEHELVGDQHCAFQVRDRKVFLLDFDSGHPTIVNEAIVPPSEEWPLHAGDLIDIGPMRFMIHYHEKSLSQKDLEEWAAKCLDFDSERKIPTHQREIWEEEAEPSELDNASSVAGAIIDRLNAAKGIVKGRLRISREEGLTIIKLNDIYLVEEAELTLIKKELHDNLNRSNLKVVVDLKNVQRMSSQGAEMFGELATWLKKQGSNLALCRVRADIAGMLHSFPATKHLLIYRNKEAALLGKW